MRITSQKKLNVTLLNKFLLVYTYLAKDIFNVTHRVDKLIQIRIYPLDYKIGIC